MDSLRDDIRLALRKLAKNPGFLSIAVLSLALGIGANTTVFSLIDAVLLRPLSVHEPERLVAVYSSTEDKPYRSSTYADVVDYAHPEVFSGLAATYPWEFSLATEATSHLLTGELVSANYFEVLGVPPAFGGGLGPSSPEDPAAVAVISHSLWTRAFGDDPQAVGKTVHLNGHPFTISGVAPEGFKGPNLASRSEIWVPLGNYSKVATGFWSHFQAVSYSAQRALDGDRIGMWELLGRLRPGVSLEQARTAMAALDLGLSERYPDTHKDHHRRSRTPRFRPHNPRQS